MKPAIAPSAVEEKPSITTRSREANIVSLHDFDLLRRFFAEQTGIELEDNKRAFLASRLAPRLMMLNLADYGAYYRYIMQESKGQERLMAIDLLTTHETWFFREEKHFQELQHQAETHRSSNPLRVWSAACSSGEEAYSIAMTLTDVLGPANGLWELVASDITISGLATARSGRYSMARAKSIPPPFLTKYCLKGIRSQEGSFLLTRPIRAAVRFEFINLVKPLPNLDPFNIVFLRNILIYFKPEARQRMIRTLSSKISTGGFLYISHSESLQGLDVPFVMERPGIYRKIGA